jgi:hypothetical protein
MAGSCQQICGAIELMLRCRSTEAAFVRILLRKIRRASLRVLEKCGFAIFGEDKESPDVGSEQVEEYMLKLSATEQRR